MSARSSEEATCSRGSTTSGQQARVAASVALGHQPDVVVDGHLFVDGGIINNFPASVMSSMLRGPVVGVDVTSNWKLEAQAVDIEDKSLLWLLGRGRKEAPNIVRILTRSGTISGDPDGGEPGRG